MDFPTFLLTVTIIVVALVVVVLVLYLLGIIVALYRTGSHLEKLAGGLQSPGTLLFQIFFNGFL